jgi:hypothetical protein
MNRFLIGVSAGTTVALMALIYFIGAARNQTPLSDVIFWLIGLYLFGWLAADKLFSNIHDGQKNLTWHMLPASVTEKYASRLILGILGFTVAWILFIWIVSFLSGLATQFLYGRGHHILNPFDGDFIREVYRFLIFQSVMLFGVIYFKKNASIKTFFTVLIYAIFFIVITAVAFKILFGEGLAQYVSSENLNASDLSKTTAYGLRLFVEAALQKRMAWAVGMFKALFWYLMMPFFWIMGYLRLRELEV